MNIPILFRVAVDKMHLFHSKKFMPIAQVEFFLLALTSTDNRGESAVQNSVFSLRTLVQFASCQSGRHTTPESH